jgi:arylsulfatase A
MLRFPLPSPSGFSKIVACIFFILLLSPASAKRPNVILIFMDDMGYNDIGLNTYPNKETPYPLAGPEPQTLQDPEGIPMPNVARNLTPTLDQMARDGIYMSDFYSTSICSPSRAMLMTGRYARRSDIFSVFFPNSDDGLNTAEVTLPEKLREAGYRTSMIGKWHLGFDHRQKLSFQMMPTRHGFQDFYGVPYSNDMDYFSLIEDEAIIDPNVAPPQKQAELTWRFTERTLERIETHSRDEVPFFILLSHPMTHIPCWPSDREFTNADGTIWPKFQGQSGVSYYYDVVMEIDHSTQRILDKLDELGIAEDTLVIFTSDNGPWLTLGNKNMEARSVGSAYPLKGAKMQTWEGGVRVPMIARWPGSIPPGRVSKSVGGLTDFLPTLVSLAGGELPSDRIIDGIDLWPIWSGQTDFISRYFAIHNAWNPRWRTIRKDQWKLREGALYNLAEDIQEMNDLSKEEPYRSIAEELQLALDNLIQSAVHEDNVGRGSYSEFEVELSGNDLVVPGGASTYVNLRLSHNPEESVAVTVSYFSGNPALFVKSGEELHFTPENWDQWQQVELGATLDSGSSIAGATFRIKMDTHPVIRELFAFQVK